MARQGILTVGEKMDLEPFTDLAWRSKENREIWSQRFPRMSKVYRDAEIETFIRGMRKVYVWHLNPDNLEKDLEFFNANDLVFYPQTRSKIYEGFSHKHISPKPGDPQFVYGVLVRHRDKDLGKDFVEASKSGNHQRIGELLKYPKCCRTFFKKVWPSSVDPIWEAVGSKKNSVETRIHPYCNQTLRYFGFRITPHLPCSVTCRETILMGSKWFQIMQGLDKEAAYWLKELLSLPSEWSCLNGIAIVKTPLFIGITNSSFHKTKVLVKNLGWNPT